MTTKMLSTSFHVTNTSCLELCPKPSSLIRILLSIQLLGVILSAMGAPWCHSSSSPRSPTIHHFEQNTGLFLPNKPSLYTRGVHEFLLSVRGGQDHSTNYDENDNSYIENKSLINDQNTKKADNVSSSEKYDNKNENIPDDTDVHNHQASHIKKCSLDKYFDSSCPIERMRKLLITWEHMDRQKFDQSGNQDDESWKLRSLLYQRAFEYLEELISYFVQYKNTRLTMPGKKLTFSPPHPKKLLNKIAPKIPSIKHSPEIMLRIRCASNDVDVGVAASTVGVLGILSWVYEYMHSEINSSDFSDTNKAISKKSVFDDIVSDRRFEQLVECFLCGIELQKMPEPNNSDDLLNTNSETDSVILNDSDMEMKESVDVIPTNENKQISDGINCQDSTRASLGLLLLRVDSLETMVGVDPLEIFYSMSLRSGLLLESRMEDIRGEFKLYTSLDQISMQISSLVKEVAFSMWTYAQIQRSILTLDLSSFIKSCCLILDQTLEQCQLSGNSEPKTEEDIIESLARSEEQIEDPTRNEEHLEDESQIHEEIRLDNKPAVSVELNIDFSKSVLEYLSNQELTHVLYALVSLRSRCGLGSADYTTNITEKIVSLLNSYLADLHNILLGIELSKGTGKSCASSDTSSTSNITTKSFHDIRSTHLKGDSVLPITNSKVEIIDAVDIIGSTLNGTCLKDDSFLATQEGDSKVLDTLQKLLSSDIDNDPSNGPSKSNIEKVGLHDLCTMLWATSELNHASARIFVERSLEILQKVDIPLEAYYQKRELCFFAYICALHAEDIVKHPSSDESRRRLADFVLSFGTNGAVSGMELQAEPSAFITSRLLWSITNISCILKSYMKLDLFHNHQLQTLVSQIYHETGDVLDHIEVDQLACIVWAFIEFYKEPNESISNILETYQLLGRIICLIEAKMATWEKHDYLSNKYDAIKIIHDNLFHPYSLCIHGLAGSNSFQDDIGKRRPILSYLKKSTSRDPPIELSILCKLSHALSKMNVRGYDRLVMITARLVCFGNDSFTFRCNPRDIIRLTSACHNTVHEDCVHPLDKSFIFRVYLRRVIHFLCNYQKAEYFLNTKDKALLMWSLADLGYQFEENIMSAKLTLRSICMITSLDDDFDVLSDSLLMKLFYGIMIFNDGILPDNDKSAMLSLLRTCSKRIPYANIHDLHIAIKASCLLQESLETENIAAENFTQSIRLDDEQQFHSKESLGENLNDDINCVLTEFLALVTSNLQDNIRKMRSNIIVDLIKTIKKEFPAFHNIHDILMKELKFRFDDSQLTLNHQNSKQLAFDHGCCTSFAYYL